MKVLGKIALDTNIVIDYFADDETINSKLQLVDNVYLPSIVIGELYYGALKSGKAFRIAQLEHFVKDKAVLNCDFDTGQAYASVHLKLRKAGKPIPSNDIWIAALAIQYNIPLVSRDKHFDFEEDLELLKW